MGWDYVQFRVIYELKRKTGLLKKQFSTNPAVESFIGLKEWRQTAVPFFFESKSSLNFPKDKNTGLQKEFDAYLNGKLRYFNAELIDIGKKYDWITNPSNNYKYDIQKHWTEIEDLSQDAGDIKFTWEKSRFSFLHTLIRYDYHFEKDNANLVFSEIENWIDANPINQGPNYKCSQEISLRTLNWIYALYYYRESSALTEKLFNRIIHTIYWQLKHVYSNINFSRKTVRNNHAITEVLMLYLGGLLFPFFPEAKKWKNKGKQWFEEEIAYQIYEDGTFLQYSHNYHRVLIQLLTWAFYLSSINDEKFSKLTYQRAKKSLDYLSQCTNDESGQLPNYGANDGALFFKLNNQVYRDYRPQLNALHFYFNRKPIYDQEHLKEDIHWFSANLNDNAEDSAFQIKQQKIASFPIGGYYTIKEKENFTFIKCGSYKDRPSHADNLHLDIWHQGKNILRDAGTYKYNTEPELVKYFNGTKAHNTVTLGDHDQMLKGPRFIWLHWSERVSANLEEKEDCYLFNGKIKAFKNLGDNIFHTRSIKKHKEQTIWEVEDTVEHQTSLPIKQFWNIDSSFTKDFKISAFDENDQPINPTFVKGFFSDHYGIKEESKVIVFESFSKQIKTTIQKK